MKPYTKLRWFGLVGAGIVGFPLAIGMAEQQHSEVRLVFVQRIQANKD